MSDQRASVLRSKIHDANQVLQAAEQALEQAVAQLAPVLVGDKQMSTKALDQAFHGLRHARKIVVDLEALLATELTDPSP